MSLFLHRSGILKPADSATPFTTEWKSAGAGANDSSVGDQAWSNPGNITASDDSYAESVLISGETTQILRATTFGFTTSDIPNGATILGIEVGVERSADGATFVDLLARLRTGAGQTGDDKADTGTGWPTSDAEVIYGGSSDTWGAGLSDSDIRDSAFGFDFRAEFAGPFTTGASVDHIRIRVHGEG